MALHNPNGVMHRADLVTLKEYVDTRFEALCSEIAKSEEVVNARLHGMNEARNMAQDQAAKFMTRDEYRIAHKALEDDAQELRDFMNKQQGKASQTALLFVSAISILGLMFAVIDFFLKR